MIQHSGYRWTTGTKTIAQMTDTYAIESFTPQSDVKGNARWFQPQSDASRVQNAAVLQALDGSQSSYGMLTVTWELPWVSGYMVKHLFAQLFGSAYSATATIRTFSRITGSWQVYNCTALWPTPDMLKGLRGAAGGYVNFPIRFIDCVGAS